jgi:hypothetical protein
MGAGKIAGGVWNLQGKGYHLHDHDGDQHQRIFEADKEGVHRRSKSVQHPLSIEKAPEGMAA